MQFRNRKITLGILSGAILSSALFFTGCGTAQKTATAPVAKDTLSISDIQNMPDAAKGDVLSIKDALLILDGKLDRKTVMKKYGYQYKASYEVSRLAKYTNLYYRHCTLPRQIRDGVYADLPRPQKKGVSSYVALNEKIEIGVFNNAAYQTLVDQVKAAGFQLDQPGYEDEFVRGQYHIFCYAGGKRIRIEKE
ncbi:hypothetical protein [Prevotella sp. AGR2160]|uniref:hypothetical protein n=1 Tax=Prevotella sp. AGR2160 TaxID=1280674 RepID=UPI0003FADB2F|nr:hypothetical protein [Prevotella sp. AGR2160]